MGFKKLNENMWYAQKPRKKRMDNDREHNLTAITDARNNGWTQSYDGLNRLIKEVDPEGGEVDYSLAAQADIRNPLSAVQDARGVATNYIRNGYGELIREVSLEAGTTHYTRDERGLITQMTDARNIVSDYVYDPAGRLLSAAYPASPQDDITYTYDEGAFGKGQLTTVAESFGVTSYAYNSLGFMTGMIRANWRAELTPPSYSYDKAGEVLSTTYPSGRIVEVNPRYGGAHYRDHDPRFGRGNPCASTIRPHLCRLRPAQDGGLWRWP